MKKSVFLTMLILITVFLVGCQLTKKAVSNYDSCKADAECYEKMLKAGNITSSIVADSVDSSTHGFGLGQIIGTFFGVIASAIAGVCYGSKLKRT